MQLHLWICSGVLLLIRSAYTLEIISNSLQCNGLNTPIGVVDWPPHLSWTLVPSFRGDKQTAFQLQVSSDSEFSSSHWDSGKVETNETSTLYYGNADLTRNRTYWKVKVWDANGVSTEWSDVTWLEILSGVNNWTGQWITNSNHTPGKNALPVFSKSFTTDCDAAHARLHYVGLGVQWAAINGKAVTDEVLQPSYSTMNKTIFLSSYDVTDLIMQGKNVLVVELGNGVYNAGPGLGRRYTKFKADGVPLPLKLLAQLEITCSDGSTKAVVSDNTWETTTDGPYLEASWYGGEEYDARRDLSPAYLPKGDRSGWVFASITVSPHADLNPVLTSAQMPPLKVVEELPCVEIIRSSAGWVFDFGQNIAGWYRFELKGKRGQRIEFRPAERLFMINGSADQTTTGQPIFDGYTFAGNGVESHTLKFVYHGFRYLEILGMDEKPDAASMTALRIRIDTPSTGRTESNMPLFNNIHRMIDQSIQSQLYSVLTDCPHREKMGWLDQLHLAIDPVFFGYDLRVYGRHLMKQIVDAQNSAGEVPTSAPQLTTFYPCCAPYSYDSAPNWGISIVLFAWAHYTTYGDIEILQDHYDNMQAYLDFLTSLNGGYILTRGLGDWEAIDQTTPFGLTETAAFARGASAMAKIASVVGRRDDVLKYVVLHHDILAAFNKEYFNTSQQNHPFYGSGSQASDAIALDIGAVPDRYSEDIKRHLNEQIYDNGTDWTVGEVGLGPFFRVLGGSNGQDYLLNQLMSSTDYPSYGFLLENGASTLTEHWDGPLGSGSQNHIILDYGDTWIYGLAGMKQSENSAAWQRIDFEPVCVENVTYAYTEYMSVKGRAAARWERNNSTFTYNITVPVGSEGTVYIQTPKDKLMLDGLKVAGQQGVLGFEQIGSKTITVVGSGTYFFSTPHEVMYFC